MNHRPTSASAAALRPSGLLLLALTAWLLAACGEETLRAASAPECGDGAIDEGEACDDNNSRGRDGCSSSCEIEAGYACVGEPSVCTAAAEDTGTLEDTDGSGDTGTIEDTGGSGDTTVTDTGGSGDADVIEDSSGSGDATDTTAWSAPASGATTETPTTATAATRPALWSPTLAALASRASARRPNLRRSAATA